MDMAEVELPRSMELTFTQASCDKRPICVGQSNNSRNPTGVKVCVLRRNNVMRGSCLPPGQSRVRMSMPVSLLLEDGKAEAATSRGPIRLGWIETTDRAIIFFSLFCS